MYHRGVWFTDMGTVEDGEGVKGGEEGKEAEMEEIKAVFESTLQAQADSSKGKLYGMGERADVTVCVCFSLCSSIIEEEMQCELY